MEKEGNPTEEDALLELYRKLRPGEPPTVSGGQQLLESRFFDSKRYDLGRVGRYKLNKKLGIETTRILARTFVPTKSKFSSPTKNEILRSELMILIKDQDYKKRLGAKDRLRKKV